MSRAKDRAPGRPPIAAACLIHSTAVDLSDSRGQRTSTATATFPASASDCAQSFRSSEAAGWRDLDSSFFFSSHKPLPNDDFGSQLSGFCDFGRFAQFAVPLQEGDGFLVCPQQFGQNERGFCNPPVSFQSLKR